MKLNLYILLLFVCILPSRMFSQIEKVIVETYYISNAADSTDTDGGKLDSGSVTYRIYIDLMPGNKLIKIYGDSIHPLKFASTEPFFNNLLNGETFAKQFKKGLYGSGTLGLDSWLTIGQTVAKTVDGSANFGILKSQDTNGSFIGGSNNDGGSAAIDGGILSNSVLAMGIPLTTADGMVSLPLPVYDWKDFGIKDFLSGNDSTIFGSLVVKSEFISYDARLENKTGVTGAIPDSNQILVAQLTTKGNLTFELNLEVEQMVDGVPTIFKYVSNGDRLLVGETVNSYLKYPYNRVCGCKDPKFLEYSTKYECSDPAKCINKVVYGCKDTMACNYDSNANFSLPFLCCYPGLCNGRDISLVCPDVRGPYTECSIYPNPTSNSIFLNVTSGLEQNISYSVYNYSGTGVLNKNLGVYQRLINQEVDLSGLSNGIYLIRVNVGIDFFNIQFIKN